MSPLQHIIAETRDSDGGVLEGSITVIIPGVVEPKTMTHDNPLYEKACELAKAGNEDLLGLFDKAQAAAKRFDRLSERVTVSNGNIYFDGDQIDNGLTRQVARFIDSNVEDWKPLVRFFEKVQTNPNEHSREQLYGFIERNELTITENGDIVLYKGVRQDADDPDVYRPTHSGHGFVDGVEYFNENLPQRIGSAVEIPRSEVVHDPHADCHIGLHAACFEFAKGFGGPVTLEIHVNPRDVGSVPDHGNKVRVSRYVVIREVDAPYQKPLAAQEYKDEVSISVKNPSSKKFNELVETAKAQKKGVKALAERRGWKLIPGADLKNRKSWQVV